MYELHIAQAEQAARNASLRTATGRASAGAGTDRPRRVRAWRRKSPRTTAS